MAETAAERDARLKREANVKVNDHVKEKDQAKADQEWADRKKAPQHPSVLGENFQEDLDGDGDSDAADVQLAMHRDDPENRKHDLENRDYPENQKPNVPVVPRPSVNAPVVPRPPVIKK